MSNFVDQGDAKDWARRIMRRVQRGDNTVCRAARIMAMRALGMPQTLPE